MFVANGSVIGIVAMVVVLLCGLWSVISITARKSSSCILGSSMVTGYLGYLA